MGRIRREDVLTLNNFPQNGGLYVPTSGNQWFVNAQTDTIARGGDTARGNSWKTALRTMTRALTLAQSGDTVYATGDIREEVVGSNLKFDITIVGCGSLHHADSPAAGYLTGGAVWRPPASPTTATPLIAVRGRGWKFVNIFFDCPVDAAAIRLARNSLDGTSEYDAGHASIIDCDFRNGLYGIEDYDGCYNVTVRGNTFESLDATSSVAAIIGNAGGGPASPRRWRILDNFFQSDSTTEGNERHIVLGLAGSLIKGNVFGTVKGSGLYIDLSKGSLGSGNVVTGNVLGGLYDTTDYVPGTGDLWYQNASVVKATTSPDGVTLDVPGA